MQSADNKDPNFNEAALPRAAGSLGRPLWPALVKGTNRYESDSEFKIG